jgi:hypothetical protein
MLFLPSNVMAGRGSGTKIHGGARVPCRTRARLGDVPHLGGVRLICGWMADRWLNEDEVRAALGYHSRIVAATLLQREVKYAGSLSNLKR